MRLSAPKQITWIISVVLGVCGILGHMGVVAALAPHAFWLAGAAFIILALATLLTGL